MKFAGTSYRIVSTCPYGDKFDIHDSCERPKGLRDFVPVSDQNYERVYRNQACASCNGVYFTIPWNVLVGCEEIAMLPFKSAEARDEYILNNCSITAVPNDEKMIEISKCNNYLDGVCFVWRCSLFWQYFFFEKVHVLSPTKNIFLFNCILLKLNKNKNDENLKKKVCNFTTALKVER